MSFSWDVACYFPYIFGSAFDKKLGSTSYSVNPPPDPLLGWGEGGDSPTKFLKREVAWQDLNFERGLLEKTGDGFSREGGCSFFIKSKLKSKIFNDKKLHQQKYFSDITKNLNWEILTKNSVTFNIMGVSLRKSNILWGDSRKTNI